MKILFFFVGACLGSMLNVICWRSLNDENYLTGRSHCEACGRKLSFHEMIPVISYLLQKGRCRTCGSRIDQLYPFTEMVCGLVTCLFMTGEKQLLLPFTFVMILISLFDRERMEFPEILLVFLLVTGVPMLRVENMTENVIGTLFLSVVFFLLRKWRGEGDRIIFLIICLYNGLMFTARVMFMASVMGMFYYLCKKERCLKRKVPFCPVITAGFIVSVLIWK